MTQHHKRIRHYHDPGDIHELTFSCNHRLPLLTNDRWRGYLSESVGAACRAQGFRLAGFVYMPEHVHLLVIPPGGEFSIGRFLAAVKRPCSARIKQELIASGSRLLERLTVCERPGKSVFRFWLEGPGYDRNLQHEKSVVAALDYIHNNPVRRGLCQQAVDWFWSSARYYVLGLKEPEPMLPPTDAIPRELFS
jgi:putative transposase